MMEAFQRGTSNVGWCEFVVQPHAYAFQVGEFWNTSSSIAFYCTAGMYGLWRTFSNSYPGPYIYCNAMLVVVGLGSALFHGTQSYAGEMLDELPMSLMAFGYMLSVDEMHWLTQKPYKVLTYAAATTIVAISWTAYFWLHNFEIFQACFAFQVAMPALISLMSGPEPVFSLARWRWWLFLATIAFGKVGWDYERYLNAKGRCPTNEWDPRFWLHANWHLCSSIAHVAWMSYAGPRAVAAQKLKAY
eukprot:gb/GFBE01062741.1/.p1 GENE.gb/GFBE01062741.1/~~gb/GFBE01062741.1/.p1  ORF type:complete len:245 (+),score=20.49 gb/GFBE01062741.1/:1-735(+)